MASLALDKYFESYAAVTQVAGARGITPSTSAYATGNVLGGLLYFDMTKATNGGGFIIGATAMDNDTKGALVAGDLYLFNALPTTIADRANFAGTLVLADWLARATKISFASYDVDSAFESCEVTNINRAFASPNGWLYGFYKITGLGATFAGSKRVDLKLVVMAQ